MQSISSGLLLSMDQAVSLAFVSFTQAVSWTVRSFVMFTFPEPDRLPALQGRILLGCGVNDRCRFTLDGRSDGAETAYDCSPRWITMPVGAVYSVMVTWGFLVEVTVVPAHDDLAC